MEQTEAKLGRLGGQGPGPWPQQGGPPLYASAGPDGKMRRVKSMVPHSMTLMCQACLDATRRTLFTHSCEVISVGIKERHG